MALTLQFSDEARQELLGAIDYYEDKQKGLGLRFNKVVNQTINNIVAFPKSFPVVFACACFPAAIIAFEGTHPEFRQSPPISSASKRTTDRPNCAAPDAIDNPAEPAPMIHISTS